MWVKIRTVIADIKIFMGRAQSYVSIANSGMLLFLFLSKVKDAGYIDIPLEHLLIPLFFVTIVMLVLIGFIEDKIKLHDAENKRVADRNPYLVEIIERLDRLEKQNEMSKK